MSGSRGQDRDDELADKLACEAIRNVLGAHKLTCDEHENLQQDFKDVALAALRRAKAEVLELATKELCMYCNDPGNWAPMSNSGYHQCNTPGPNMVRCHATKIHALIREADARAAQIEALGQEGI